MLEIKNVSKIYPHRRQPVEAVRDINLVVKEKERVAIVGPSGCGKTTLLKMVAGLLAPSNGKITLFGEKIEGPSRERGLVAQSFALFPWLTVRDNISFGLNIQSLHKNKRDEIVARYLELVGLTKFADFYPKHLSGGMQQRVALARTLANDPKILLLDEPFGALDSQTRRTMRQLLLNIWTAEPRSVLLVTHDVDEALLLCDTVYALTSQPGTLKEKILVDLPRPHAAEIEYSENFLMLKKKIQGLLV